MNKPSVKITVPVYNEEKELEENISTLYGFCDKNLTKYNWHITIADNASTDNTPVISSTISKKNSKILSFRLEQKGRGRAVKRVWSQSKCDYCVYMDLDLSTDLVHLPNILKKLESGYDITIGSRLEKGAKVEGRTIMRRSEERR